MPFGSEARDYGAPTSKNDGLRLLALSDCCYSPEAAKELLAAWRSASSTPELLLHATAVLLYSLDADLNKNEDEAAVKRVAQEAADARAAAERAKEKKQKDAQAKRKKKEEGEEKKKAAKRKLAKVVLEATPVFSSACILRACSCCGVSGI